MVKERKGVYHLDQQEETFRELFIAKNTKHP